MEFYILCLLTVSVLVNIFLITYTRYLLGNLSFVSENLNSLVKTVIDLRGHLSDVYELERFYGDPTLEDLLRHSVQVVEVLEDFEDIYELVEDQQEEQEDDDEEIPIGEEEEASSQTT